MGANHTTLSSASVEDDAIEPLMDEYVVDHRLFPGSGRMMRTFRLSHRQTGSSVVAKTMWIHSQEEESVKAQEKELERIREALKGQSHVAPFWLWKVGNLRPQQQVCPVAIVRNNVYTTLSDRLESRPFLTNVEKLWIIYQLLNALQQMHDAGVLHGFLTTENIGLTSWNYLVILDIASYKARTSLPDDDPSEYLYYFQEFHKHGADTTQREKRCYLAPERFFSPKEGASNVSSLTKSMDVFSAGCILLETSLNGERALDLGDLMDYRKKKSFPPSLQQKFQKIESSSLRAACRHMLHLDASQRLSPKEYLERLKDIMPRTFEEALDPFVDRITNQVKTPDARIALAAAKYGDILVSTVGVKDADGETHFANILGPCMCKLEGLDCESAAGKKDHLPQSKVLDIDKLLEETDALLKKLETLDLEKAMTLAGTAPGEENPGAKSDYGPTSLPGSSPESFLVFAQVVLATLRHVYRPSSKLVALELLHRLAIHSSDETRLQRIVPSTISLLHDQEPLVRASALNIMTSTLSIVRSFPPSDSKIFPQYIFKRVTHLIGDPSLVVRVAFSSCIASLAETSRRFLDISHAVRLYEAVGAGGSSVDSYKAKGKGDPGVFDEDVAKLLECPDKSDEANMDNSVQSSKRSGVHNTLIANTYDAELSALQDGVSRWVVHITTDPSDQSSGPKRALLRNLARLCNFFGRDGVMTFILPQILAFLNDRRDWQLRASLFDDLPSVCYIVGRAATQHFVLPCLETALVDSEDQVLRSALTCLASLVVQGLLSRAVLLDTRDSGMSERAKKHGALFVKYTPLLLYPSPDVRHGAILFVNSCCKAFGYPDCNVFLVPCLRPYIRFEPSEIHLTTIEGLEKCLVAPWTKQQLEKEMAKVSQVPALSGRNKQGEETIESGGSGELKLDEHIKEYLSMLSRGRTSKSSSLKEPRTKISIEGSLKLSQSIKFPAQSAASTRDPPIPQWFANAREISKEDDTASEYSSLQSVASLNQVYGLSIMLGSDIALATPEDIAISEGIYLRDEELKVRMKDDGAKTIDAAASGEWGSECILDPSLNTTTSLVGKLKALDVPTLSPRLGVAFAGGSGKENLSKGMGEWRPKIETMICTTSPIGGHAGPVSRLAVSHDQRFFVSGSYDSTCKVWELGKIGTSAGVMESATSYSGHASNKAAMNVRVNDIVILESSHSVASASSDGRVHVWRVDLVSGSQPLSVTGAENTRVSGCSVVKTVESTDEGEVLAVSHFNSLSASVLAFATQRGIVHSWDLRADKEPFVLKHPAELGYLTSMAIGTDRNWVVAGTSRGYIALWDIRWRTMTKLWKHSSAQPINRLATTYAVIPSSRASSDPRPLVFVASGNECGMFDVTDGVCRQGFRVVCPQEAFGTCRQRAISTSLKEIDISGRNAHRQLRRDELVPAGSPRSGPQMYAMVGSIGGYDQNYLITGGDDAHIRYWDFSSPSKCYAVSGQIGSHQRPSYERFDIQPSTRLMVCRQSAGLRLQDVESSRVPRRLQRGLVRAESRHHDAILDLKLIQSPVKAVVSCSRDGSISVFK